jgi:uncharacterized membrane protein YdbT with pleckstrin-like domain
MKQLDPKSVWLFFIGSAFRSLFFGFVFIMWSGAMFSAIRPGSAEPGEVTGANIFLWVLIILLVLFILSFVWSKLTYYYYRYELREDGFRKELGVIRKKYVTIPYERIQNVDINRGIVSRILGLSEIQIQTAGTGGVATGEGRLPGLTKEDAEAMRDELIARSHSSRSRGGL